MESKKPIPLHNEEQRCETPSGAAVPQALLFPTTSSSSAPSMLMKPPTCSLPRCSIAPTSSNSASAGRMPRLSFPKREARTPTIPAVGAPLAFLDLSRRARGLAEPALASPTEAELAECRQSLQGFFDLLHSARLEFAFRTITEITRYLHVDFEFAADKSKWRWQDVHRCPGATEDPAQTPWQSSSPRSNPDCPRHLLRKA